MATIAPCAEGQLFLLLLANGVESPAARKAFALHAADCQRCRQYAVAARERAEAKPTTGAERTAPARPEQPAEAGTTSIHRVIRTSDAARAAEPERANGSSPAADAPEVVHFRKADGQISVERNGRWRDISVPAQGALRRSGADHRAAAPDETPAEPARVVPPDAEPRSGAGGGASGADGWAPVGAAAAEGAPPRRAAQQWAATAQAAVGNSDWAPAGTTLAPVVEHRRARGPAPRRRRRRGGRVASIAAVAAAVVTGGAVMLTGGGNTPSGSAATAGAATPSADAPAPERKGDRTQKVEANRSVRRAAGKTRLRRARPRGRARPHRRRQPAANPSPALVTARPAPSATAAPPPPPPSSSPPAAPPQREAARAQSPTSPANAFEVVDESEFRNEFGP